MSNFSPEHFMGAVRMTAVEYLKTRLDRLEHGLKDHEATLAEADATAKRTTEHIRETRAAMEDVRQAIETLEHARAPKDALDVRLYHGGPSNHHYHCLSCGHSLDQRP